MKTSSKRFTLIELLVVIAIIGILAGLVFPALGTVRNNAKKSKANSECQSMKTAIIMYESEFSTWPVKMSGSKDAVVDGSNYIEMCKVLTGKNSKKTVFYEVGVGYDENKGILDPWGRPYQVILDVNFDNQISSSVVQVVSSIRILTPTLPSEIQEEMMYGQWRMSEVPISIRISVPSFQFQVTTGT